MSPILLPALVLCLIAPLNAVISATANAMNAGFRWGLGNRMAAADLPGWAIRLSRAHANLIETLPSFVGVVVIAALTHAEGETAVVAAWAFVGLRLAFAVIYTAGITALGIRTLVWFASLGALGVIAWPMVSAIFRI